MKRKIVDAWKNRPYCSVELCENLAHNTNTAIKPRWRKHPDIPGGYICGVHHAKRNNYFGGYQQFRKDYCENWDGSILGKEYICTTTIYYEGQLQVDHIDGNPDNNSKENCQTLCACCHVLKTHIYGDGKTNGRKYYKELKSKIARESFNEIE